MTKQAIRSDMRSILPLSPDVRGEKSRRICERIVRLSAWRSARTVVLFAPEDREPDIELLWKYSDGRRLVYPRVAGTGLTLYSVESVKDLEIGPLKLREPRAIAESKVSPESVELVLIPGGAFTESGHRCGRGGGFYDRFIAALPPAAVKVGICFEEQLLEEIPMDAHDMSVDIVIAE